MDKKVKRQYLYSIFISLLLHLLLIILFLNRKNLFDASSPARENKPLVFEFASPAPKAVKNIPDKTPEPDQLYEVKDNPNADDANPEKSSILSTRSSKAASPEKLSTEHQSVSLTQKSTARPENQDTEHQQEAKKSEDRLDARGTIPAVSFASCTPFSKRFLTGRKERAETDQRGNTTESDFMRSAPDFSSDAVGEFRLSTYKWDWAPWMIAFQNKLYRIWSAPPAWQMGLIYGYTDVVIKINKQGELMNYQVLKHEGHESLRECSVSALEGMFPFKSLPPDFPDDSLEIRLRMIYPNVKELAQNRN